MTNQEILRYLREQYNTEFSLEGYNSGLTLTTPSGEALPEGLLTTIRQTLQWNTFESNARITLSRIDWEGIIISKLPEFTPAELKRLFKKHFNIAVRVEPIMGLMVGGNGFRIKRFGQNLAFPDEVKSLSTRAYLPPIFNEGKLVGLGGRKTDFYRFFWKAEEEEQAIKELMNELENTTPSEGNEPDEHDARLCPRCGCAYHITDYEWENVSNADEEYEVCRECRDNFSTCDNCDHWIDRDNDDYTNTDNDSTFCSTCAPDHSFYCDNCDYTYDGDGYTVNGSTYCNDCYSENTASCDDCGDTVLSGDSHYCEDCEQDFCESCWESHDDNEDNMTDEQRAERERVREEARQRAISESRLRNPFRPAGSDFLEGTAEGFYVKTKRFVGVEIEAEKGDTYGLGLVVPEPVGIATDGSLHDRGVEVQTPPATLNKVEELVNETCKALQGKGYKGTKACGLHVHIDARDIRDNHAKITQVIKAFYSFEDIIYSSLPPSRWNSTYSKRLAHNYLYASFRKGKDVKDVQKAWYKVENDDSLNGQIHSHYNSARYYGLNIHSLFYRGTVELRYHSGTVNPTKILNWVNFMLRAVDWAINNYDEKKVQKLFDMETSLGKFEYLASMLGLPYDLRDYLLSRVNKFNPNFIVKFNKGKGIRATERRTLTRKKTRIDKLVAKEQEKHYKELKSYWDTQDIRVDDETLKQEAKSRAQGDVRARLSEEERKLIENKHIDGGFISNEEIERTLTFIQQGRNLQLETSNGEGVDEE